MEQITAPQTPVALLEAPAVPLTGAHEALPYDSDLEGAFAYMAEGFDQTAADPIAAREAAQASQAEAMDRLSQVVSPEANIVDVRQAIGALIMAVGDRIGDEKLKAEAVSYNEATVRHFTNPAAEAARIGEAAQDADRVARSLSNTDKDESDDQGKKR